MIKILYSNYKMILTIFIFKLKDTGVSATLTFVRKSQNLNFKGSLKGKILKIKF